MWSRLKKAVKAAVRAVKAVVRVVVRAVVGAIMRAVHIVGSVLDLVYVVKKKMRIQVFILRDSETTELGLVGPLELDTAINTAKQIFLDKFKIEIKPYGDPIVQTLSDVAPAEALDVECDGGAFKDEFGKPGDYFAGKVAGWAGIPISLQFPITVFVVRTIRDKIGCSIPIADYVTLSATSAPGSSITGVTSSTTLAHELAHTCLLMHRDDKNNLLFPDVNRGTDVTKWQRWAVRTSRHCTWW